MIGLATVSGPDAGDTHSYIINQPAHGVVAMLTGSPAAGATVTYAPGLNYFGEDSFTYKICDWEGLCSSLVQVNITVNADNDAPYFDNQVATTELVEDHTSAPMNFSIGDVDDTVVCSSVLVTSSNPTLVPVANILIDQANSQSCNFTITGAQDQNILSAGGGSTVTFSISDGSKSAEMTFLVNVQSDNDRPTDITLTNDSIPENSSVGSPIGELGSIDVDSGVGESFTYTLSGADAQYFMVEGDTLKAIPSFNYEKFVCSDGSTTCTAADKILKDTYTFTVTSLDQKSLSTPPTIVTISIDDVNESPNKILITYSGFAENAQISTTVGFFSTEDPDIGDTCTFVFSGAVIEPQKPYRLFTLVGYLPYWLVVVLFA